MNRWVIVGEKKVRLLHAAKLGSETDDSFRPGQEFDVVEEVLVGDRKFLRLPDGRFVCERSRKEINKVVTKRLVVSQPFAVGQKVVIKQKTKSRHGTVVKLNPSKAVVEVSEGGQNQKHHVPYGMLSKEEQAAKASQAKARAKAAVRQPKVKAKPAAKKDLRMALGEQLDEESADNDEESSESSDDDEKAHRRGWDLVYSAFKEYGAHPSMVSELFDPKDLISWGRKDY
ncbi:Hypothetical protein SCF082_LOCUS1519 [Durusdinium trenchii]|uniref:Uncharacterized protein n=1 Tax=Durusdinium trenchii TaxID=1381693 RepID=A0ABP0HHV5_9DINO